MAVRYPAHGARRRVSWLWPVLTKKNPYRTPRGLSLAPSGPCEACDGFFDCSGAFAGRTRASQTEASQRLNAPSDDDALARGSTFNPTKSSLSTPSKTSDCKEPSCALAGPESAFKAGSVHSRQLSRQRLSPRRAASKPPPGGSRRRRIAAAPRRRRACSKWRERPPASRAARSARPSTEGRCRATCPRSRAPPVEYCSRRRSRPTASRATLLWLRRTRPSPNLLFVGSRRCQCPSMR